MRDILIKNSYLYMIKYELKNFDLNQLEEIMNVIHKLKTINVEIEK